MKFFKSAVEDVDGKLFSDTMDWLFDEQRLDGIDESHLKKMTAQIKKLDGIGKNGIKHKGFDQYPYEAPKNDRIIIMFKSKSQSKDFIRHVRNAVAHGNVIIRKRKGRKYVELRDYKDSKHVKNNQTAYIFMPLMYIFEIYKIYIRIKG